MIETIYNIFYFVEDDVISEAAICSHDIEGTDEEKSILLKAAVPCDLAKASRARLPKAIDYDIFVAMHRLGRQLELFDSLFKSVKAPRNPFCCITAIVDGRPQIDISTDHSPLTAQMMQSLDTPTLDEAQDWLAKYATESGFNLPQLLNDEYFDAIRLLFKSKQYVSCMKLLLSFIDTVSFLAYGNEPSVFVKWLNAYANLGRIGITADELWEMRNALLHMSTLDSRKVLKNRVRRIGFCVASRGVCPLPDGGIAYFNLLNLIDEIANGISYWITHINANNDDFLKFIARHDRILSDDRLSHIAVPHKSVSGDPPH